MRDTELKSIDILLVEDSPTDILLTQEAFEQARLLNQLHVVEDGIAALAFLRRQEPYTYVARPDLILLDLNLPKKGGREMLAELKSDPDLGSSKKIITQYSCYVLREVKLTEHARRNTLWRI